MANFVYSVGYSLEKIHSGMIVYLCDLWNEGEREPLKTFLSYLGIPVEDYELRAAREWRDIDLVIFDAYNDFPVVAIEMQVDVHEHLTSKRVAGEVVRDHQTVVYPRLLPEGTPFLFITLGTGEHFRAPYGERARWVRITDFYGALEAIAYSDPLINGWREA